MTFSIKNGPSVLAVLFFTCTLRAQPGPAGTWRVDGVGPPLPWEAVLRTDGPNLTGAVTACASNSGAIDIYEGKVVDGGTITFKCKSLNRIRTVIFTGTISGDEIAFTWKLVPEGGNPNPDDVLFGNSAPHRFTAKRVADDPKLGAMLANETRGVEFAASINSVRQDLKIEGRLFLPSKVSRVRAVVVMIGWSDFSIDSDPQWRKLSETLQLGLLYGRMNRIEVGLNNRYGEGVGSADRGGADGVVVLLQRLARESGHPELVAAPLLFSGPFGVGPTFAASYPQRTIGFVTMQSTLRREFVPLSQVPALIFAWGENKPTQEFWTDGRAAGAPWTLALVEQIDTQANYLIFSWVKAVLRQRLQGGSTLRRVMDASSWMGNIATGEVAPYSTFTGPKRQASWLPDEATARVWQTVLGKTK